MNASESLVIECQFAVRAARAGKIRLALDAARLGYRRAQLADSDSDKLLALNTLAFCQSVNGAYIEAMASAMDACLLARVVDDRAQAAQALCVAAMASVFMLDTGEMASVMLDHCLAEAMELADPTLELLVRNSRGVVFLTQRRFDESIAEFEQARALLPRADGTTPAAVLQCNIAGAVMRRANAAAESRRDDLQREALQVLATALTAAREEGSLEAEARARYALGALHAHRGEHEPALEDFQAALTLSENLTHHYRAMVARAEMGDVLVEQGRLDQAHTMFQKALDEGEMRRPCRELHRLHAALADIHERRGNTAAAGQERARAATERAVFERDCELARRDLAHMWRELKADPGAA